MAIYELQGQYWLSISWRVRRKKLADRGQAEGASKSTVVAVDCGAQRIDRDEQAEGNATEMRVLVFSLLLIRSGHRSRPQEEAAAAPAPPEHHFLALPWHHRQIIVFTLILNSISSCQSRKKTLDSATENAPVTSLLLLLPARLILMHRNGTK